MARRRYHQFCPLAKSLDVLGERWTLLIVRDLFTGPKRYTDLRAGLPGLATDLLATRLRELQEAGLVERREVPPPTPATLYALTERGEALRPALLELARWGRALLVDSVDDTPLPAAAPLSFEVAFRPEAAAGLDESYQVDIGGHRVALTVRDGDLDARAGDVSDPAVTVVTDAEGFMELARGRQSKRARIDGDPEAAERMMRMFSLAGDEPQRSRSTRG